MEILQSHHGPDLPVRSFRYPLQINTYASEQIGENERRKYGAPELSRYNIFS